ncbi:MAG: PAS domain S-box protein [Gammaproteobacteria bacterium]|nr:PAS domain S-box protein [Gammaproteobacteria bacterium]
MATDKILLRALLIDSDAGDRKYVREQLNKANSVSFELTEVALLEGSTEFTGKNNTAYDLILLNLAQPGCTRLEGLEKLLPLAGDVPIIVLSGKEPRDLGLDAFRCGAQDYLIKGEFDCELLVRTIRNATERARIKIELKSSEQKYRALFENVVAGVFSTTLDGQFISANPSMVKLLGYASEEELLEIDIPSQIHACPEQRQRWVEQVHASGEMVNAELRLKRKDGREITVLENSCLVYDSDGKPSHYQGTLIDLTERLRAEAALRKSEERFELAVKGSLDGLYDWDMLSDQFYASPRLVEILGFDPQFKNEGHYQFQRLTHPDDYARVKQALIDHLREDQPFNVEFRLRRENDEYLWLQAKGQSVRDDDGRATRMAGSVADIGERKKAEEALRSSQSFYQLILNSVPISIAYVEKDETITFANQNYLDWFRVRKPELIGKKIRHITSQESYEIIRPRIEKVLAGELVSYSAGAEREMQDFELEVTYVPHRDDSGEVIGFFSVVQDMTQHRRLEAELRQAQKMEAVGQLTGGVAHDFNNLLSIIVGNLQLLSRPLKEQKKLQNLADSALKAALRGAELTKRLLALSRRQVMEPRLLDVSGLVMGMNELLKRTLGSSIDISTRFDKNLHSATIDPGQLESALLNLAINARDAMPEGGQLQIEAGNLRIPTAGSAEFPQATPGEYVLLSVSDTGCGMPSDVADRAFEPFFTTKDVGKGSGLGLSMVHGFVEKSGGFSSIRSNVGVGTRVRLLFPMSNDSAAGGGQQVVELEMPAGNECILVVEDDDEVRKTAIALLQELGYRTLEAGDGPSALRVLKAHPEVDLLFSDVMMPGGMRGPVLAHEATKIRPDMPVLFATGFAESTIMHQGMEAGPDSVICKPYGHDELARKIRRVLEHKEAIAPKKAG